MRGGMPHCGKVIVLVFFVHRVLVSLLSLSYYSCVKLQGAIVPQAHPGRETVDRQWWFAIALYSLTAEPFIFNLSFKDNPYFILRF